MATQVLCSFNKFGYCKYRETCRKRHITEICEKTSWYLNMKIAKLDSTIKELDEKTIESKHIIDKLQSVEKKLDNFDSSRKEMFEKDSLIEKLNMKVSTIEKTLSEKDDQIVTAQLNLNWSWSLTW